MKKRMATMALILALTAACGLEVKPASSDPFEALKELLGQGEDNSNQSTEMAMLALAATSSKSSSGSDSSGSDSSGSSEGGSGSESTPCFGGTGFTTSATGTKVWQSTANNTYRTYSAAVSYCTAQGGRLPTYSELYNSVVATSGCTYNTSNAFQTGMTVPIEYWTSTSAGAGAYYTLNIGTVASCTQAVLGASNNSKVRCICDPA